VGNAGISQVFTYDGKERENTDCKVLRAYLSVQPFHRVTVTLYALRGGMQAQILRRPISLACLG
jgi:hypothetical protein